MAKITGNTTATPMAVPDLAQTDERKANYIKNKKVSYLENDSGYVNKTYVDNKVGEIDEALNEIIALQELYMQDNAQEMITFNLNGNNYNCPKGMTWAELETYDGGAIWQAEGLGVSEEAPFEIMKNGYEITTIDSIAYATRSTYISDIIRDVSESISYY